MPLNSPARSGAPARLRRALASALVLGTAAVTMTAVAAPASAAPEESTLTATDSFPSQLDTVHMGLTFDGSSYWAASGGSTDGERLAQYDADGALISRYSPGIDFRMISSANDGTVYASAFASNNVYVVSDSGVATLFATLEGAPFYSQGSISINEAGDRFLTHTDGTVSVWNLDGSLDRTVTLDGWGGAAGNSAGRMAETAGMFLTLNASAQRVQGWDQSGNLVASFELDGVDLYNFDADYSFSASDNAIYVSVNGTWQVFPLSYATVTTGATFIAGDDITATASMYDSSSDLSGETVTFSVYAGDVCTGEPVATTSGTIVDGEASAAPITLTVAGDYQWVAQTGDLVSTCGEAPFTIEPGAVSSLEIAPADAEIAFDASQAYTATGTDDYDNVVANPSGVIYTVDGGTCIDNVCSAEPGTHTVTATLGDVTAEATLVVTPEAPAVLTSPEDTEVLTGADATFSITAGGGEADIEWQSSVDGIEWATIDGATTATLTIPGVNPALDGTWYRAVVSNATGTDTSDAATLTVPAVGLSLEDADGNTIVDGDTVTEDEVLTAAVDTLAPDTTVTMWLQSEPVVVGSPTADATGVATASFGVPQVGAGQHSFVVTNAAGAVLATLDLVIETAPAPPAEPPVTTPVDPTPDTDAAPAADDDELSATGAEVLRNLGIAIAAVAVGLGLMLVSRRRTLA